ncbi:unnamed protein product, partial [Symbiodinium sp. KB8]
FRQLRSGRSHQSSIRVRGDATLGRARPLLAEDAEDGRQGAQEDVCRMLGLAADGHRPPEWLRDQHRANTGAEADDVHQGAATSLNTDPRADFRHPGGVRSESEGVSSRPSKVGFHDLGGRIFGKLPLGRAAGFGSLPGVQPRPGASPRKADKASDAGGPGVAPRSRAALPEEEAHASQEDSPGHAGQV